MRRKTLLLAMLVLVASTASAVDSFEVDITSENTRLNPSEGETAAFYVNVTNTGDSEGTFETSYSSAASPVWINAKSPINTLAPGESGVTEITVSPDEKAVSNSWGLDIRVVSWDDGEEFQTLESFDVVRDRDLVITNFKGARSSYKPNSHVNVSVDVKNVRVDELPANQYQVVLDVEGDNVTEPIPSLELGESASVGIDLKLENYEAGVYDLEAVVREIQGDVHSTYGSKIEVEPFKDVVKEEESTSKFFGSQRSFKVSNNGNIRAENVTRTFSLPWYASPFVSFSEEPVKEGDQYTWKVEELEPGEEASFTYSVSYWPLAAVAVIIAAILVMLYWSMRKVSIVKSVRRGEDYHNVHLRVKNNTGRTVGKVRVQDFVPGIASLIEKFDSRSPERIQNTEEGTKLTWRLGQVEPGEERIISYRIKPKVQVEGTVSIPNAEVFYQVDGKNREATSNPTSTAFPEQ
ncbi:MAG: hypothetical protein MUP58_00230 [Candidatus Nanohaloarchaeota archaeon QJJ-9]|nr:hypothetical protein [Candidatus Nanohaloarchaeota archaeon QJJ-9]